MLNGIRIFTSNNTWRRILACLDASIVTDPKFADVNIDSMKLGGTVSSIELKSLILQRIDDNQQKILKQVFGGTVALPRLQMQIIVLLYQTGGMSAGDLKTILGYVPDVATHTIDTAIYNLRKAYGRDFIKNKDGKYFIGKL